MTFQSDTFSGITDLQLNTNSDSDLLAIKKNKTEKSPEPVNMALDKMNEDECHSPSKGIQSLIKESSSKTIHHCKPPKSEKEIPYSKRV